MNPVPSEHSVFYVIFLRVLNINKNKKDLNKIEHKESAG